MKQVSNNPQDTLTQIQMEKLRVRKDLKKSAAAMQKIYGKMIAPPQQPATKMEAFMNAFDQGMALYDGVMMGWRIVKTVKGLFGHSRNKKKKW